MKSDGYKKYLSNIRKEKFLVVITQVFILVFLIMLWQYAADKELINTFITSSPRDVVNTIIDLYRGNNLFNHIWVTVYETLISFSLATIIGTIVAIILWYSEFLYKV